MVVIFNDDRPGVIGSIGCVLGSHGININTLGVGHKGQGKAIFAVSLDKMPSEKCASEMADLDFVNEIYVCKLG
jgi:D-3-phosphoglycerate dehydrogenase